MSDITKKYVDYAGLQEYDSQIKSVISTDFVGATSSSDGAAGRVPAPTSGDENKYLRGDGTWSVAGGSVTGVKGDAETSYRDGNVNITPANIGLGNVDNTSDENKPISTAAENQFKTIRAIAPYNIIPYTTVKSTTIAGVTITNNLDGTYTINGTSTEKLFVDLISGEVDVASSYYYEHLMRTADVMHLIDGSFKLVFMTVGNDNESNIRLKWTGYDSDETTYLLEVSSVGTDGIKITHYDSYSNRLKYLTINLLIAKNVTYDNVTIKPAIWSQKAGAVHPGAGSLPDVALFDYIQKYTRRTFMGTTAEWTALDDNLKRSYQIVILRDD